MPKIEEEAAVLNDEDRGGAEEESPSGRRDFVRAYEFYGVETEGRNGAERVGTCPWCNREGKFALRADDGRWRCYACAEGTSKGGGNFGTFTRLLFARAERSTPAGALADLASDRGLLSPETLKAIGVAVSPLTREVVVPAFAAGRKEASALYRYVGAPKRKLCAPPGGGASLFGLNLYDPRRPEVFLFEGPWDLAAVYEVATKAKRARDGSLVPFAGGKGSLASEVNFLAVPGAGTFFPKWAGYFSGKRVTIFFDNDADKVDPETERVIVGAGPGGVKRTVGILSGADAPPSEVRYLRWGETGSGYDPDLPSGYDVRDALRGEPTLAGRVAALNRLLTKVVPAPEEYRAEGVASGKEIVWDLLPCTDYRTLVNSARKALKFTDGLDVGLSVLLASIASTPQVGDQLWVKLIGPPSCGKSTLCEAVSTSKRFVYPVSTFRGFHSGYLSDKEGTEDNSLIAKARNKTVILKDGDTLLNLPDLPRVLSEARDVYDRTTRSNYRHGKGRVYEALSITVVIAGTEGLRALDSSELGERFLDVVVVDEMDEETEREIALRKARSAFRDVGISVNGKAESTDRPEAVEFKRLAGGYVEYLRNNVAVLSRSISFPEDVYEEVVELAGFVSFLRGRPSKKQEEKAQRELSFRLTSQLIRLASFLAIVLNRDSVDREVVRRVRKVALDTARGRTFELVKYLYRSGPEGARSSSLATWTGFPEEKERALLAYLRKIGAVKYEPSGPGKAGGARWTLTDRMARSYEAATGEPRPVATAESDENE